MRAWLTSRARAAVPVHVPAVQSIARPVQPVTTPWSYVGRHRSEGTAMTRVMHDRFAPRHCGGETCLHDHPGEPPRPLLLPLGTAHKPTKELTERSV